MYACKCAVSHTLGSLYIFVQFQLLGSLPNYVNTSDSRITARYMHTSGACERAVMRVSGVSYECAVSPTLGSLHIFMHTSVTRLTTQLHEHIGQSDQCTVTCTHQVHVNVQ